MTDGALYDRLGVTYTATRREDPRLAAAIHAALGDAVFALLPQDEVAAAVEALRADLRSGAWERRNADILERDTLDLGFRVVVAEYG
jgi:hypothetical protein